MLPFVSSLLSTRMAAVFEGVGDVATQRAVGPECRVPTRVGRDARAHAAVNSLWLPRSAHVIEIFPASKRRWGYRNICQYTGCRYTQFRGGVDLPLEAKHVAAEEWIAFLRGWLLQAGLQEFLREP